MLLQAQSHASAVHKHPAAVKEQARGTCTQAAQAARRAGTCKSVTLRDHPANTQPQLHTSKKTNEVKKWRNGEAVLRAAAAPHDSPSGQAGGEKPRHDFIGYTHSPSMRPSSPTPAAAAAAPAAGPEAAAPAAAGWDAAPPAALPSPAAPSAPDTTACSGSGGGLFSTKYRPTSAATAAASARLEANPKEARTAPVGRPLIISRSSQHTCPPSKLARMSAAAARVAAMRGTERAPGQFRMHGGKTRGMLMCEPPQRLWSQAPLAAAAVAPHLRPSGPARRRRRLGCTCSRCAAGCSTGWPASQLPCSNMAMG